MLEAENAGLKTGNAKHLQEIEDLKRENELLKKEKEDHLIENAAWKDQEKLVNEECCRLMEENGYLKEKVSSSVNPWQIKHKIDDNLKYISYSCPSEEFDLTKMLWGDHDILTATSHEYFTAASF